jgi:hypothetical protein
MYKYVQFKMCMNILDLLQFKPEGHGFETQWGEWILSIYPNPSGRTRPWGLLSL